jgi:hypothetical protein
MPKKNQNSWLQTTAVRVMRVHFFYVAAYILSIIVFDSWNLLTHDAVAQHWTIAGVLLVINVVLWYLCRMKFASSVYIMSVLFLVVSDIVFAAYNVYWQRGIAGISVALFAIPIVVSSTLRSRSTLLATTALASAGYSIAAVRYFFQHYGESYRVELWGDVAFYCATFFVLAFLLLILIKPSQEDFKS